MKLLQALALLLGSLALANAACADGTYASGANCLPCNWYCAKCTGPNSNQCTACSNGFYLQPSPLQTTCLTTCPFGTYMAQDGSNKCKACDASCDGCYLAAATCINCKPNYVITGANTCSPCATGCNGCVGSPANCTACKNSNWVQNPDNTCTLKASGCAAGTYQSGNDCLPCNQACATCTGALDTQCLSCSTAFYQQPAPAAASCKLDCPKGWYQAQDGSNKCKACDASCDGCYLAAATCVWCAPGYVNTGANTCSPCAAGCDGCVGSTTNCTDCDDGYYHAADGSCQACTGDCATCETAPDQCKSCKAGAKPVLVGSKCYAKCTGTTLANGQTKCTPATCAAGCRNQNCRDATVNCVNCKVNWHREDGLCVQDTRRVLQDQL